MNVCIYEYMKVLMYGCMNVICMTVYDVCDRWTWWDETRHVRWRWTDVAVQTLGKLPWSWCYCEQIGPLTV